jgi:2-polyprenyl-3-methyl-5-hydroxy-6-metoxy-1,4-benzoquinol methylase
MIEIIKKGVKYIQKPNGTLYAGPLNNADKVGGSGEEQRNSIHNAERINRIKRLNENAKVLDFGCGKQTLVNDILAAGLFSEGYDKYNPQCDKAPITNFWDVVTLIEVIEHLSEPYEELDQVFSYLKEGGTVMIETSFVDWMKSNDPYINPELGHSTIFSHAGLDELMIDKGFVPGNHINRNVRLYHKPKKEHHKLTLITLAHGNPIALKRTLENTKGIVDEVILGDVSIHWKDRELFRSYQYEYNLKIAELPFNYLYKNGFSAMLNELAECSLNDFCLYLNVGELIAEGKETLKEKLALRYNSYYQIHPVETHHWIRTWNKKEMQWSGRLHEECCVGQRKLYPKPLFTFVDSEKDMADPFYAACMNRIKEMVYFKNLVEMVDNPAEKGGTHEGWVQYAKDSYDSLKERLHKSEDLYQAFETGDYNLLMTDLLKNTPCEFESSTLINFQGNRKDIL